MFQSYDAWKTTPPYRKQVHALDCHHCKTEMFLGEDVLYDCNTGEYFCSKDCVKAYIKENLDEIIADLIDRDFCLVPLEEDEIA